MTERTLVVIKPDGVRRNLAGKIISYYESAGLRIAAMKMATASKSFAEKHYAATDEQIVGMGNKTLNASRESRRVKEMKRIFGSEDPKIIGKQLRSFMVDFLASGPVVAIVFEGRNAVSLVRKVTGFTDPSKAERGTVRGDLGEDSIIKANAEGRATENLVHASGDAAEAEREIKLWFPEMK